MDFSVIICTYNYGHLIGDALRSLAAQTDPGFELLIVDDGSDDDTETVVRRFTPEFRNCVYLRKPHTGLADSRNVGVHAARGTHIAYLDADDLWSPEYLTAIRSTYEKFPQAGLVFCDGLCILNSGYIVSSLFPQGFPAVHGRVGSRRDFFPLIQYMSPSAVTFPKSTYLSVGPYDTRFPVSHDRHWVIRALTEGIFCLGLDRRLILYRRTDDSMSTRRPGRNIEEWLAIYADTLALDTSDPKVKEYARRFIRRELPGLLAWSSPQEVRRVLAHVVQCLGEDPVLRLVDLSTHIGSPRLANIGRTAKNFLQRTFLSPGKIDLSASPEKMFRAV